MQIMESTSQNNSEDIHGRKGRNGSGWRKKIYLYAIFSKDYFVNYTLLYIYIFTETIVFVIIYMYSSVCECVCMYV